MTFAPIEYRVDWTGRSRPLQFGHCGVLACALLPDVDQSLPGVAHRTITHTVLAMGVAAAGLALLGLLVGVTLDDDWREYASVGAVSGALGVGSHLLGDVLTPMGIQPFRPLSSATFSLHLVAARNPTANETLFLCGGAALLGTIGLTRGWKLPDRASIVGWRWWT